MNPECIFGQQEEANAVLTDYIRFIVKYTCMIFGKRKLIQEFKKNKSCTLFDVLTPSDDAFTIVIVENNKEKWDSQVKKIMKMDEEEDNNESHNKENKE